MSYTIPLEKRRASEVAIYEQKVGRLTGKAGCQFYLG